MTSPREKHADDVTTLASHGLVRGGKRASRRIASAFSMHLSAAARCSARRASSFRSSLSICSASLRRAVRGRRCGRRTLWETEHTPVVWRQCYHCVGGKVVGGGTADS
jgi:hypothetical protein